MKLTYKSFILLAVLPLIFVSQTLESSLYAAICLASVSLVVKTLSYVVPKYAQGRFIVYTYMIVSVAILTVLIQIFQTFFTPSQQVGLYVSLLMVNGAVLLEKQEASTFVNYLYLTIIAVVTILLTGFLREFLATGGIGLFNLNPLFDESYGLSFLQQASGGFILSGLVFALVSKLVIEKEDKPSDL